MQTAVKNTCCKNNPLLLSKEFKIKVRQTALLNAIKKRNPHLFNTVSALSGTCPNCNDFFANCCNCCKKACPTCQAVCLQYIPPYGDPGTPIQISWNSTTCCYDQFETGQGAFPSGFQLYHTICYKNGAWIACIDAVSPDLGCGGSNAHACASTSGCLKLNDIVVFNLPTCVYPVTGGQTTESWKVVNCATPCCQGITLPTTLTASDGTNTVTLTYNGSAWVGSGVFAGCGSSSIQFYCSGTLPYDWGLSVSGTSAWQCSGTATCEPFSFTCATNNTGCTGGPYNFTVTA